MNEITELELVEMLMFREFHCELADIEKTESDQIGRASCRERV